jgi:hypothetical protein
MLEICVFLVSTRFIVLILLFKNEKTVKLISQEEMTALRKATDQSQPVSGRKMSFNEELDDQDDDAHRFSQSQADKGECHICSSSTNRIGMYFSNFLFS